MALEKFKTLIKTKAKGLNVNLSQPRIDAIAARLDKKFPDLTEDADHQEQIDLFNELQPFADIAKDDDRIRTLEKNKGQANKNENPENPTNEDPQKKTTDEEPPSWAKPLFDKLSKLETEKAQGANRSKAADLLKAKGVPASFLKGRTIPEKDEEVEAFVEAVSTDWEELRQEQITAGLMTATPPGGGDAKGVQGKAIDTAIDNYIGSRVEKKQS